MALRAQATTRQASERLDLIRRYYPELDLGGYTAVNGTAVFYLRVNSLVHPDSVVLDVGCGRGSWLDASNMINQMRNFKGRCAQVVGIDVDDIGATNSSLDRFGLISDGKWPCADESVDVVVADYVMEHISDVDAFFMEANRVLRPGGHICLRTPNQFFYVSLISRLIPNALHSKILARVQQDRKEGDVFPTVYKCNTRGSLKRALSRHGFAGVVMYHEAEPLYMTFNPIAFWFGVMHQRFAPKPMRANLFAFAKKV